METGKTNDKTKTLALSGLLCSATLLLTRFSRRHTPPCC